MGEKKGNREYQDSVFRMLFQDKESAIELYNALEGTSYNMETEIKFTTLEDAIYHGLKNDLGFLIDDARFVMITEHQSTINENMPIRQLQYVGRTYEKVLDARRLYNKGRVTLPTPLFYVLYTGESAWDKTELRLSDSYTVKKGDFALELVVKIIDLRYNEENEILKKSEKLKGYSYLMHLIHINRKNGMALRRAIDEAVQRCLREHVLEDFLLTHSAEVGSMLFYDITVEEFIELRVEEEVGIQLEKISAKLREELEAEVRAEASAKLREELEAEVRAEASAKLREELEAESRARVNLLYKKLFELGLYDEAARAAEDNEYQQTLFEQYGL